MLHQVVAAEKPGGRAAALPCAGGHTEAAGDERMLGLWLLPCAAHHEVRALPLPGCVNL